MQSQQKVILTDDGELQTVAEEAERSAVFCIHCGSANRADGHFCRSCGQSLDAQVIHGYLPSERKTKRSAREGQAKPRREPIPMTAGMVIVELFTLLVMGGLFGVALIMGQTLIVIAILLAWFMVEAARHGALN